MKTKDPIFDEIDDSGANLPSLFFATFNRFEFALPRDCVEACSRSGSCNDDVYYWRCELNLEIEPLALAEELKEYGAWSAEELSDHDANLARIIWIAACNIKEEEAL